MKIYYKFSLVYLKIEGATAGTTAKYGPGGPTNWLDSLSSDSRDRKESIRATEGHFLQKRPRPWTEVILKLIFLKHFYLNGVAHLLDMEKLKL